MEGAGGKKSQANKVTVKPNPARNEESLNYKNLDLIHNGKEAMTSYAKLSNYTKEEKDSIRTSLLKYCWLDTFAMVKIWEKLKEVITDD